jgi:hypothetical protein
MRFPRIPYVEKEEGKCSNNFGIKTNKLGGIEMEEKEVKCNNMQGCGGAIYGLGFIGSAYYYISTAIGLWSGVLGFLKAVVWPAFLVFELLKFVGA